MSNLAAALAVTATVLSPIQDIEPGDNGHMPSEHCLPFAECMPVEECIQFVYGLELATREAEEQAIEDICFYDETGEQE